MALGPFDLNGGPFLMLYGALMVVTIIAGVIIPRWLRPEGRAGTTTDADDLAYLAGGSARMAESLVAGLIGDGSLAVEGSKFRLIPSGRALRPAEAAIMRLSSPAPWSAISGAAHLHAKATATKLVDRGLMIDGPTAMQLRVWQTLPYLMLFGFGAIKWEIGVGRDRPVGLLTALLIVTAVLALIRFAAVDRRTQGGMAVLASAQTRLDRLRRAPTAPETAMAVAVFGTAALVGSPWGDFHKLRAASSSGGDGSVSSSDGGSDGGSGCGGGGCGGCGS